MNELLFFVTIFVCFGSAVLFHKLFGKAGLYAWIAFAVVYANIEVLKNVTMFGMQTTLGNVMFGCIFLATDMLNEHYGYKESKKGVYVGLAAILSFLAVSQLCLLFIPNEQDFISDSFRNIFGLMPRITIASVVMYLVANLLDVKLYQLIKNKTSDKHMWLRNNLATMVSQTVENFFFHVIAFAGVFEMSYIIEITITVSIIEVIVAACDTPFLYLSKKLIKT